KDPISFNQFLRGITTRDGRVLDAGCGIHSRTTLSAALKSLEKKGIVVSEKGMDERGENETTIYNLRFAEANPNLDTGNPNPDEGVVRNSYHRSTNGAPPVVRNSYPQETVKQETEIADSNIRKSNRSKYKETAQTPSDPIGAQGVIPAVADHAPTRMARGVEGVGAILARTVHTPEGGYLSPPATTLPSRRGKARRLPNLDPETYEAVVAVIKDYSRKLGDGGHTNSNITQAANLIVASGCDFNTFYMHVIDAYKITCQRNGLDNRSGYFFKVLRDRLLPSDPVGSQTP
ncbi:MAG: hypothetical protein ACYDAR_17945, partial [Thermomicrobiales bacterium]